MYFKSILPVLFRGSAYTLKAGDTIARSPSQPKFDDRGYQVYASPYYWHAATYGFKQMATSGSVVSHCFINKDVYFSSIVMGVDFSDKDYFRKISRGFTYIAHVPIEKFSPTSNPAEWGSKETVMALKVDVLRNNDLLRNGVQVFTTDADTLHKKINPENKPYIDGIGLGWTREEVSSLVQKGIFRWENARPEYAAEPKAIPEHVLEYYGFEKPVRPSGLSTNMLVGSQNRPG